MDKKSPPINIGGLFLLCIADRIGAVHKLGINGNCYNHSYDNGRYQHRNAQIVFLSILLDQPGQKNDKWNQHQADKDKTHGTHNHYIFF